MSINLQELVSTELKKFNMTDIAIAEIKTNYMSLTINGIEDKQGYQQVKEGKAFVKKKRIEVEKVRKELKEDSLSYGRKVDAEAKRITNMLTPIEDYLDNIQKKVDDEIERIKQEKIFRQKQLIQSRIDKLQQVRARIVYESISLMNDEDFESTLNIATQEFNQEQERIKQEAEAEKIKREAEEVIAKQEREILFEKVRIEEERVSAIYKQQESERICLNAIAKELADKQESIKIEQDKIIAIALEEQRKKEKLQREAFEEQHREFLKPDKQKLLELANKYLSLQKPEMESPEARDVLFTGLQFINRGINEFKLFGEQSC